MISGELARCGLPINTMKYSGDCVCGQFAGAQRIINSFAGEWFDDASSVADQEQIILGRGNWGTRQWRDGPPLLAGWQFEFGLGPAS